MRIRPLLAAFSLASLATLSACDSSSITSVAPNSSAGTGTVSFRLSASDSQAVAGTVDSVLVTATTARGTTVARAAFGSLLTLADLPAGQCLLKADLYDRTGLLHWTGSDTVQVTASRTTQATLVLHNVLGSVQVDVKLDSTPVVDSSFVLYSSTTHPDYPLQYTLTLDARGNATRFLTRYLNGAQVVDTARAQVDSATLVGFRALLQASAARHPAPLPAYVAYADTLVDSAGNLHVYPAILVGGSTITRSIAYADGKSVTTTLDGTNQSNADWTRLDPIDAKLVSLFPSPFPSGN